ncbi:MULTISPECIES: NeuD/PglB/VioB family sugar acetyltransferase [unclassified Pseudomonas]|uniref:NeuD/PglB/VioB family sugar acetyltransferase n=1 Tax=unclassified Pseudomonas TaxID=196821 RepID=UPI000485E943|nr:MULTISPECIES: NeuD/PglB/VioB family sugar acetyltransferase [unclassified Pseudomonas]MBV7562425.1 NeuD/PglB/VioB family sugar acetyltransferase [Pseudomonas sp. sia0905]PZW71120.1 sugar O-acyltransferase (sialic acid O-acetyltransferase NeuD family) [Pseudomonas sp. URMO17WK12:I1]
MSRLAILGASGHGKVVADAAECCGWQVVDFFDDAWPQLGSNGAWQVVGDTAMLKSMLEAYDGVVVAIGNNAIRYSKLLELEAAGANLCNVLHPAATISRRAVLGNGVVAFAGVVVNADAHIGLGAILNTGCSIDHDCVLGAGVHVSPGARLAGGVRVGDLSWIGIGASVRQLIHIGYDVMVGAGAVVVSDIADRLTVVGTPARPLVDRSAI